MKKIVSLALVLALGLTMLAGCGSSASSSAPASSSAKTESSASSEGAKLSGNVATDGSTSMEKVIQSLGEAFTEENPDVNFTYNPTGSGSGITAVSEGSCDIGLSSRALKDEEKKLGLKETTVALDGIAIIVNNDNPVKDLTIEQIADIYTGKITNWKDVGGDDADIAVVSREEGSGTRGAFTEITGVTKDDKDNTTKDALVQSSTGAVVKTVKSTPNSIGYVSLEAVDNSVKAVKVEGVDASADTVLDGTYKISRPFIYVVGDKVDNATQDYIDYVMSDEGQKEVEKAGFIPVGNNK